MKRLSILSTLFALLLVGATGCLKDKGFEAGQYGIDIKEVKAVAFPGASQSPLTYGLDVSASPQIVNGLLAVTLEISGNAESDVTVTLANSTGTTAAGQIAAYNAANGTNVQILPAGLYSFPTTLTIPAGTKSITAPITVTNTTSLDPNLRYGIAITITSASNGYVVASNQQTILVIFTVKNKYDGRYRLTGFHNRVPYTFPYDTEIHLITTGPSSVIFYWPEVSSAGHPIGVGAGNNLSWYGPSVAPNIMFDPATNLVTNVFNTGAGGPPISMFPGPYTGPPNTPNPPRVMGWNPVTRAIIVDWRYNANNLRGFFDNLTYLGPR